jgi:hypothetical protein
VEPYLEHLLVPSLLFGGYLHPGIYLC